MTQDTKKLLKTDFGKQLDELFFRTVYTKNDFKTPTTFLAVYTEYNFSQKERVDITNILVDYLHYGKVK